MTKKYEIANIVNNCLSKVINLFGIPQLDNIDTFSKRISYANTILKYHDHPSTKVKGGPPRNNFFSVRVLLFKFLYKTNKN